MKQRKERIKKQCLFCKSNFEVIPCFKKRNYCSVICWRKSGNAHRGYKHTIETKNKISENVKGKNCWNEERRIKQTIVSKTNLGIKKGWFKKKNGKTIDNGYVKLYNPNSKSGKKCGIKEHRDIMEKYLGRKLDRKELVHHINCNKSDNRIENLQLVSPKEHIIIHKKINASNKNTL